MMIWVSTAVKTHSAGDSNVLKKKKKKKKKKKRTQRGRFDSRDTWSARG